MANSTPVLPYWLPDHLIEHDPGCKHDILSTTHYCEECVEYLEPFQPDSEVAKAAHLNFSRSSAGGFLDSDVTMYDYTSLCNMWVDPDFMKSCNFWPESLTEEAIKWGIAYASELLYNCSGRQFNGMCERIVSPGCQDWSRNHSGYRGWSRRLGSKFDSNDKYWGCVETACDFEKLILPGPISSICEIIIDGEILPPSSYRVLNNRTVIRTDGEEWPKYNDLTRSPYTSGKAKPLTLTPSWVDEFLDILPLEEPKADIEWLEGTLAAPQWAIEFIARHPKALPSVKAPWVDSFLGSHGIECAKLEKDAWSGDRWILRPGEFNALDEATTDGCSNCVDLSPGDVCGSCGSHSIVTYSPQGDISDMPEWVRVWSHDNGLDINSDFNKSWIDTELRNRGMQDLADRICESGIDPNEFDEWTIPVVGEYEDWFCETFDTDIKFADIKRVVVDHCGNETWEDYREEFCACQDVCDFYYVYDLVEQHKVIADDICLTIDKAPEWAKEALLPNYERPKIELEPSEELPSWVNAHLGEVQSAEVDRFFADWLKENGAGVKTAVPPSEFDSKITEAKSNNPEMITVSGGSDPEHPAWVIRYYQGTGVPYAGQVAAAILASDVAGILCGAGGCFSTKSLSRVTIDQSVDLRWGDIARSLENGQTGIAEVDLWVKSVNRQGINRSGYGLNSRARNRRGHRAIHTRRK